MFTSTKRCFVGENEETAGVRPELRLAPQSPLRAEPLAGVPGRAEAEEALTSSIARGTRVFAAVFIVDRIHLLNDCFGYTLGDRLLGEFHERLRRRLAPADRIFRWSGTSFVALLEHRHTLGEVRSELDRVASGSAEVTVRLGSGALALATAASWAVFPLQGGASGDGMVRCIDHYVAANLGR
jgi:diguanylate cyclase